MLARLLALVLCLPAVAWAAAALWIDGPASRPLAGGLAVAWTAGALAGLLAPTSRLRGAVICAALLAGVLGWWLRLEPSNDRDWQRDVARLPSAVVQGDRVLKAGFLFGGQIGEGALRRNGRTSGYYNSVAASYGLQAGAQTFGYALFFMNDTALEYLDKSAGFELGVGPSLVVVDTGAAKSMTSTTLTHDVYAFVFDQKGLMAGIGIQGSKITRISK